MNHKKVPHPSLEGQDRQGNSCAAKLTISTIFSLEVLSAIFLICFSNSPDKNIPLDLPCFCKKVFIDFG